MVACQSFMLGLLIVFQFSITNFNTRFKCDFFFTFAHQKAKSKPGSGINECGSETIQ
jgi:hypothetical protein